MGQQKTTLKYTWLQLKYRTTNMINYNMQGHMGAQRGTVPTH
jgi:hypothetical protein